MAHNVRKVDYFYVMISDKPGEGAKILADLATEGVNLLAFSGFPSGRKAQLDLIPEDSAALKRAGIAASAMDYAGPRLDQGIAWWGEWKPALAYAKEVQRPILLSFASPRVEQVPGVW